MRQVPVSLLGHRDHGKSTLIGRLLMETDSVPKERVAHAKSLSEELSTRFEYAFLMDSFREERTEGMTMDTTSAKLRSGDDAFELIDVPGHKTLVKNMLSGASRAQYALLVVSAKPGEGFQEETRLHLALAKMLGLEKIVACVTKMDLVDYDRGVFERVRSDVDAFLSFAGFDLRQVKWIPVSAMVGDNLCSVSGRMPWYQGRPVLDAMKAAFAPLPDSSALPLRFFVQDRLDLDGRTLFVGPVKQGILSVGDALVFQPQNAAGTLRALGSGKTRCEPGQNDGLQVDFQGALRPGRGSVAVRSDQPWLEPVRRFSATLFVLPGFHLDCTQPLEFQNASATICGLFAAKSTVDIHAGREAAPVTVAPPMAFLRGRFTLDAPAVVEPFDRTPFLGRFVIRQGGTIAAVGVVNSVDVGV